MARTHSRSIFTAAALIAFSGAGMAASTESDRDPIVLVQLAQVDPIALDFTGECLEDMATFKMTNTGQRWPTTGKFSVYRIKGNVLVSQRRMRLSDGQTASFRVKAGGPGQSEYGLFVEPEWYTRPFLYDQKVVC